MAEPRSKPPLAMTWSRTEGDLAIRISSGATLEDGRLVTSALGTAFTDELKLRGYDLTTLRFSIRKKKKEAGNVR